MRKTATGDAAFEDALSEYLPLLPAVKPLLEKAHVHSIPRSWYLPLLEYYGNFLRNSSKSATDRFEKLVASWPPNKTLSVRCMRLMLADSLLAFTSLPTKVTHPNIASFMNPTKKRYDDAEEWFKALSDPERSHWYGVLRGVLEQSQDQNQLPDELKAVPSVLPRFDLRPAKEEGSHEGGVDKDNGDDEVDDGGDFHDDSNQITSDSGFDGVGEDYGGDDAGGDFHDDSNQITSDHENKTEDVDNEEDEEEEEEEPKRRRAKPRKAAGDGPTPKKKAKKA